MKQFRIQATSLETQSIELRQQKEKLHQDWKRLEDAIDSSYCSVPEETIVAKMVPGVIIDFTIDAIDVSFSIFCFGISALGLFYLGSLLGCCL